MLISPPTKGFALKIHDAKIKFLTSVCIFEVEKCPSKSLCRLINKGVSKF